MSHVVGVALTVLRFGANSGFVCDVLSEYLHGYSGYDFKYTAIYRETKQPTTNACGYCM